MAKFYFCSLPKTFCVETDNPENTLRIKFVDLSLGNLDVDYPLVTKILYQEIEPQKQPARAGREKLKSIAGLKAREVYWLPWDEVQAAELPRGILRLPGGVSRRKIQPKALAKELLIGRDILDAAIIDLPSRRVTRANDLLLAETGGGGDGDGPAGGLRLEAADTGIQALLRRLSRGRFRRGEADLLDWKYVEFLRGDPGAVKAGEPYRGRIRRLQPGEIVHIVEALPYPHAAEMILLLPEQLAADIFELMGAARQLQIFEELDQPFALRVLAKMSPDAACDLIGRLPPGLARSYLDELPEKPRERVIDLLRYPPDTVGGIMTNDIIAFPAKLTVGEARERLRKELAEPDFVYFIYVVDGSRRQRLQGVITLRRMLVARDEQRLDEIMNPYLVTLHPLDAPRMAAYRLIDSQIAALPVVDQDGKLLGVVTVDAAVSEVAPEAWSSQAPRIFS